MIVFDLHSHSTASDGTLTPHQLVARAKKHGVDVLALTDHDIVSGLDEATAAAEEYKITLVPGVEISTTWGNRTLHVVGLGINHRNAAINQGLERLQTLREQRAEEMGHRLAKAGIPDALAGAQRLSNGTNITRTHFARYLVEVGKAETVGSVFKSYLASGKPGYVNVDWASLEETIQWIQGAGGLAVIAHPNRYKLSATKMRALLADFVDCGGDGLEVASGGCERNIIESNAAYAKRFDLKASVGSDFHDPGIPWIELGKLPRLLGGLVPIWKNGFNHTKWHRPRCERVGTTS